MGNYFFDCCFLSFTVLVIDVSILIISVQSVYNFSNVSLLI